MYPASPDARSEVTVKGAKQDPSEHLRTQFLRRLAHDIASPTGVTLTVLEELAATSERPELVAMARRSLKRLLRLSEHLALVSELEAKSMEPEMVLVDLCALCKRALDDAIAVDGRKDVVANCELPDLPAHVHADLRLLHVVVREIVGNALRLASSKIALTVRTSSSELVIRIEDDGPGLSEDARATLGQRFARRSLSRGLGLSMSMALEIVRVHGGTLTVEDSSLPPGRRDSRGAAVVVTLQLAGVDGKKIHPSL
jgi:two-component system sensor histidine kinase KdpD